METYHRRRYKKDKQPNTEMEYTKTPEQESISAAGTPHLTRHDYVAPPASSRCSFQLNDADGEVLPTDSQFTSRIEMVKVGSVYEIDHSHLPPRTPAHLRSIRVVMVSEKTQLNVGVRFPSMESLESYFSNSSTEMYPELDDKFVMGTVLAAKVLLRQIPSREFAEKKHLEGFWLVKAASVVVMEEDGSEKGICLSELKCKGMVGWGIRRQVMFLEKHQEKINVQPSSSFSKGTREVIKPKAIKRQLLEEDEDDDDDGVKDEEEEEVDDDEEEDDKEDEDTEEQEEDVMEETKENLKRKRYKLRNRSPKKRSKKVKLEKKRQMKTHGNKGRNKCRELLVLDNPKDRWSAERYQVATENLLEVMKAKGATATKPILRPNLRTEARKRIGDTGLLDHLLKHMAGKIAPGGTERFRRRHNADGAMEYWLESADLVDIRKEAGVNDPYWIPPPGWKPGDCPTQDPICAKELRGLKEEISKLKRNAEEMVPRQQYEEEMVELRREIELFVSSKKHNKENEADGALSSPSCISQELVELRNSLDFSKASLTKLFPSMGKYEEQLMVISDYAKGIEQEIKKLVSKGEEETRSERALMASKKSSAEKEKKQIELKQKKEQKEVQEIELIGDQKGSSETRKEEKAKAIAVAAEKKAEKIERLKSGFRICKPQGTFLWPSMARNATNNGLPPQVVVQVEDLLMVPTPPSVSSSYALVPPPLPYHHQQQQQPPPSPVKPIPERRAVTVTVSTLSNDHGDHGYSTTTTTTTTTNKSGLNLNDIPNSNPIDQGFIETPPSQQKTITTTTTVTPHLVPETLARRKMINGPWNALTSAGSFTSEAAENCSSTPSCMSTQVGNWLALATASANSASDESSHG